MDLQQIITTALTAEKAARYNDLKNKDDNFEILSAEEQQELSGYKKAIAHAKANQHILPLKEEFKRVFPQVAGHFNADESKAIIGKVVGNLTAEQILEAIVKKNITSTQDGVDTVVGQTNGVTLKDLTKALKNFGSTGTSAEAGTIAVGTFKLADYNFTHPKATEPEFVWEFGKRYGGLAWQNGAVAAITHKKGDTFGGTEALDAVLEKATPEFKSWLEEYREGQGPSKGKKIYDNKRAFYKYFGLDENREPLAKFKVAKPKAEAKADAKAPAAAPNKKTA